MKSETTVCEVCGYEADSAKHPCRFEKACSCWYGEPCKPAGASMRQMNNAKAAPNERIESAITKAEGR